jgi:hypothetical protein
MASELRTLVELSRTLGELAGARSPVNQEI